MTVASLAKFMKTREQLWKEIRSPIAITRACTYIWHRVETCDHEVLQENNFGNLGDYYNVDRYNNSDVIIKQLLFACMQTETGDRHIIILPIHHVTAVHNNYT